MLKISTSPRVTYLITFGSLLILLIMRGFERFQKPIIWAEDGIWLSHYLNRGFFSLFHPDAGYFLMIQRSLIGLAMQFPMAFWPFALTTLCFLTYAAVSARFSRETYSWILPSRMNRILVCCLFAFLPGLSEVLGNAANLGWVLCFYVALTYLKNLDDRPSFLETLFTVLCMLSAGQTVILLPILTYRIYLQLIRRSKKPMGLWECVFFVVQLSITGLNFYFQSTNDQLAHLEHPTFSNLTNAWFYGTLNGMVLEPFFAAHWTALLWSSIQWLYWPVSLGVSGYWLFLFWKADRVHRLKYLAVLSWTGAIVLSCLVRDWGFDYYGNPLLDEGGRNSRLHFVLAFMGVFFWVILIEGLGQRFKKIARFGIPTFAVWYVIMSSSYGFKIPSLQHEFQWDPNWKKLKSSIENGCPKKVYIPIEPQGGWAITYESPLQRQCSESEL